ncbi:NAD(P)/FAD-dependent oxidoreductase [Demequina sp.]|uniref:NAD(P)/FAD-dependent oxidoreductase n=1 Tax=Demequina sp. TaxID=2050685 RepID=UPI003D0CCA7E
MSSAVGGYGAVSLWLETCGDDLSPQAPLARDIEVDVAIVGAGLTGLWTAYYVSESRPDLRIAVLEKEIAGFGASGRNGGWASALFPSSMAQLAKESSRAAALAQHAAMRASIDEVIRAAAAEGIDAGIAKGGTVTLARSDAQLRAARAEVDDAHSWGLDEVTLLDAEAARARVNATGTLGAMFTPDCAAIQPAKLVRGLARAVRARGVQIFERTPVVRIEPHRVVTGSGVVTADFVVRATEGFTSTLEGHTREIAPVYSLIVATEPLPQSTWNQIGLAQRETFTDFRHLIIYGQRTADDRLVFGGRGAPYHFGSRVSPSFDRHDRVHRSLRNELVSMFPVLAEARFTHRWGGNLGIARDWHASVGLEAATGLAWAGGYVGDGVTTTNLAGRTLRDLILGNVTELTALPWVGHRSRAWEVEPFRWLAINAGLSAMKVADAEERLTKRKSLLGRAMSPLMGGH